MVSKLMAGPWKDLFFFDMCVEEVHGEVGLAAALGWSRP